MAEVLFWKLKGSLDVTSYYWRGVGSFTPIANPLHAVIKAKNFVWNTDLYRIYRLFFRLFSALELAFVRIWKLNCKRTSADQGRDTDF